MVLSRSRQRLPAAFVTCLLLLTGAGEILGACYCAHRGGEPMEGHGPAHGVVADEVSSGGTHGHGVEHPSSAETSAEVDTGDGGHGTENPASNACRALCALACSGNAGPTPDGTELTADPVACAAAAPAPAVESADMVPPTARPHILPLSQAPPTTS